VFCSTKEIGFDVKQNPNWKPNQLANPSPFLLSTIAKECGVWLVGGSIPEKDGDKLYNTSLVVWFQFLVVFRFSFFLVLHHLPDIVTVFFSSICLSLALYVSR
jgi:hypothetical protein